jgi:hypothetical protein
MVGLKEKSSRLADVACCQLFAYVGSDFLRRLRVFRNSFLDRFHIEA